MCDSQSETFTGQVTKEENLVIWAGDSKINEEGQKVGVGGAANDVVGKNATFKVYADGRVVCSGVDSKINGLVTSTSETYVDFHNSHSNTTEVLGHYILILEIMDQILF